MYIRHKQCNKLSSACGSFHLTMSIAHKTEYLHIYYILYDINEKYKNPINLHMNGDKSTVQQQWNSHQGMLPL